jgi:hypothetical protein
MQGQRHCVGISLRETAAAARRARALRHTARMHSQALWRIGLCPQQSERTTVAHDCGLIINPLGLTRTIEGNIVMAASRTLFEEVQFDANSVTSVDWETYPILEMRDAPEAVDVVLLNRPDLPATGAGEPATGVVAPAIANAIFDATGKRLRRVPFTAKAILSLLGWIRPRMPPSDDGAGRCAATDNPFVKKRSYALRPIDRSKNAMNSAVFAGRFFPLP